MSKLLELIIGIKRRRFRGNDPRKAQADAEYRAKRPGVLTRFKWRCVYCTYVSKINNQVHHLDDDHHNNSDENLAVACMACHPYQHVGEPSKAGVTGGEGLGAQTRIVAIPELSAQDLNHLQRAIGSALLDSQEGAVALKILEHIASRADPVMKTWDTTEPVNFAAAMVALLSDEYAQRKGAVGHLRLLFKEDLLKQFGRQQAVDYPALPVSTWEGVAKDVLRKVAATQQ